MEEYLGPVGTKPELFLKLVRVTEKFLDVVLDLVGVVPRDRNVMKSLQQQQPLLLCYPSSPAAIALKDLAEAADKWPRRLVANGKLEFFADRVMRSQPTNQYGVPR